MGRPRRGLTIERLKAKHSVLMIDDLRKGVCKHAKPKPSINKTLLSAGQTGGFKPLERFIF